MPTHPKVEPPCRNAESSDAELACRFRDGDHSAFVALVRKWQGPLLRIAFRIVGQLGEAEDVRQTVLLRMLEAPERLPQPDRFAAWIRRCTVNESLLLLRRHRRDQNATKRLVRRQSGCVAIEPIDAIAASDESQWLRQSLAQLEPDQRALLALRFDDGLTFRDISIVMERPTSTVKSQVAKAIEQLRILLSLPDK